MPTNEVIAALEQASEGLLYQSEADEPFESFVWKKADGELSKDKLLKRVKKPAKTSVEEVSLKNFFEDLTAEEDWHEDKEKAAVAQYQNLQSTIEKNLAGAKVFKVGAKKVSVFIVGKTDEGDWAGLKTMSVET